MRTDLSLNGRWTLTPADRDGGGPDLPTSVPATLPATLPATVPGCVHTDLLAAGVIPDPYLDENESALHWVGRTAWRYHTTLDWSGDRQRRVDLVCDGLDTVATISLNDVEVGRTVNMHRSHRFRVEPLLRAGPNTLSVTLGSAWEFGEAQQEAMGPGLPNAYPAPFNYLRKMACNFGWDWGPTVVTAGIWRGIRLEEWSVARMACVRPIVTVDGGVGRVQVEVDVEREAPDAGTPLSLTVTVADQHAGVDLPADSAHASLVTTVPSPRRWWPHTLGDQPLYDLTVELSRPDGEVLDRWHRRVGFRSVRLDTSRDDAGSAFTLVVNDVPVFARGANWIPDDCFPSRVDRDRYRLRLRQAVEANVELVRVWGGGIYEDDDFFELCDELGLMVWQDFLFACAAYPEDEPLWGEVEAEARDNVARLMPHPSLVLWNGNNENLGGFFDWGWREQLGDRPWGSRYYLELLPRVVAETDPSRPYWPGSPWSGDVDTPPNDPAHGTVHVWDVWNDLDYTHYRDWRPRFVAEFGFQGPPAYSTLRDAIHDDPLTPGSPGMLHHQKAVDGYDKIQRSLDIHLPPTGTFDDWHFAAQLNQARAVTLGIEHFRSLRPRCMGTVIWQLNDCWPVTSWAAIDGSGVRKPAWYAMRHAYADRLLTVQPDNGALRLYAVNDSTSAWHVEATARRLTLDGDVLADEHLDVVVDPLSQASARLPTSLSRPGSPSDELVVVTAEGARAFWYFIDDRHLSVQPPALRVRVEQTDEDTYVVTVGTDVLVRDLCLFADRLHPDANVDDMLITLLPGESCDLVVRSPVEVTSEQVSRPPVLSTVNDLAAQAARPAR